MGRRFPTTVPFRSARRTSDEQYSFERFASSASAVLEAGVLFRKTATPKPTKATQTREEEGGGRGGGGGKGRKGGGGGEAGEEEAGEKVSESAQQRAQIRFHRGALGLIQRFTQRRGRGSGSHTESL